VSAIEVIEEIRKLPPEDQEKVAAFCRQLTNERASDKAPQKVSEEFTRVADEVFTTNAELFRKLAE